MKQEPWPKRCESTMFFNDSEICTLLHSYGGVMCLRPWWQTSIRLVVAEGRGGVCERLRELEQT